MKKWKQIPVWAITLLLTFLIIFPSFASDNTNPESYSELAAEISPCVVTILVYEYNGKFKGQGSGFFYNKNGDIVTNSHVITKNTRAEIKTKSGNIYPVGSIIERNEKKDFLKAQTHLPKDSPFLKIARKYPAVGDKIMVAGSPLGFEQTITE
ncbi:MAG: S1C family serine protease, partial [Proteobacteria bacterium]|nr:S1C family serine protease [Pseudomonadota bacterium]